MTKTDARPQRRKQVAAAESRNRQVDEPSSFEAFCNRLGIRHQGCVRVELYSNGSVTATYQQPGGFLNLRVVHWLEAPRASIG